MISREDCLQKIEKLNSKLRERAQELCAGTKSSKDESESSMENTAIEGITATRHPSQLQELAETRQHMAAKSNNQQTRDQSIASESGTSSPQDLSKQDPGLNQ